ESQRRERTVDRDPPCFHGAGDVDVEKTVRVGLRRRDGRRRRSFGRQANRQFGPRDPLQSYFVEGAVEGCHRVFARSAQQVAQYDLDPPRLALGDRQGHTVRADREANDPPVACAWAAVGGYETDALVALAAEAENLGAVVDRTDQADLASALQPQRRLTGDRHEARRRLDQAAHGDTRR